MTERELTNPLEAGVALFAAGRLADVIAAFRLVRLGACVPEEAARLAEVAWAVADGLSDHCEDELAAYDLIVEVSARFPGVIHPGAAHALYRKALALGELGRWGEESAAYDDVVRHCGDVPEFRELAARALLSKGIRAGALGETDQETAAYRAVVWQCGDATDPELRRLAAIASEWLAGLG